MSGGKFGNSKFDCNPEFNERGFKMAVYQVEQYYIHINFGGSLSSNSHDDIEALLSDEGFSNFEFQDECSVLVVDDIPDEHEGETLEEKIKELVEKRE